jgi:Tfp pilus assembly PilM family ATPase/Tfp pilus assembly protein PilN
MSALCFKKYIGLSINNTVLRAVVVDNHKKKITSFVEQPINEEIMNGGKFLNPGLFKNALQQLIQQGKEKARCISISLSERYALTRELSFPNITDEEIAEAVHWQAKNTFPLPIEDMYLDWKTLKGSNQEREVFIVALPRKLVDDLVDIVSSLGLNLVNIQTSATCLGRLLPATKGGMQILVNIGRDGATATVVSRNLAKMTSTAIFKSKEAKDIVDETVETANKLVEFYRAKDKKEIKIEKLLLTGEFASDKLKEQLEKNLKIASEFLKLPVSITDKKKELAFSEAIAIALAPVEPPASNRTVNLLPTEIQNLYDSKKALNQVKRLSSAFLAVLLLGLVICAGVYLFLFYKAHTLSAKTKEVVEGTERTPNDSLEVELRQINKRVEKLNLLEKKKKTIKILLTTLPYSIPEDINITSWQYERDKNIITIEGRTSSRETLLAFQKNLEDREDIKRATLPLESLEKKVDYKFNLTLSLK